MERGRGAKRGRGKIASGGIRWKSHFHAKPKNRNCRRILVLFSVSRKQKIDDLYVHFEFQIGSRLTK